MLKKQPVNSFEYVVNMSSADSQKSCGKPSTFPFRVLVRWFVRGEYLFLT